MKNSKQFLSTVLFIVFLIGTASDLWAQRNVSYRDLAMRNQQKPVSFDFFTLPGNTENTVSFVSVFSFSYGYLPFKKLQNSSENEFFSTINLDIEVFKADKKKFEEINKANSRRNKRRDYDISVEGLESVGRAFWSDTAFAKTYEQSQSNKKFISGNLSVSVQPGIYNYVLKMKRGDQTEGRISRAQAVRIKPYSEMETGSFVFGQELITDQERPRLQISNRGNNVEYAKDFYALAHIPQYESGATYTVKINRLAVVDEDTSKKNQVYNQTLTSDDIRTNVKPKIASSDDGNYLDLYSSEDGFAYALVKIPNSNFKNALYRITIDKKGQKHPAARGTYRSLWADMPTSLLNLDVAIDMLHYIVDDKTLDRLSSGSRAEREKKFREFWEKRDPNPKTEFNELMAEYYRRIDYAYENFTTENMLGYESDRGKIYIKFGPPENIERKFPTNGATTEIWTYKNRQFVFRATTGFGDFKLVSD